MHRIATLCRLISAQTDRPLSIYLWLVDHFKDSHPWVVLSFLNRELECFDIDSIAILVFEGAFLEDTTNFPAAKKMTHELKLFLSYMSKPV